MTSTTRRLAGAALALTLAGCGGGSSGTTPTTLPPTTTVPPCTQTVLFSDSGSIPAGTVVGFTFSTGQTGRVDILIDWTFADSDIGVYLTPASTCTEAGFNARSCNFLIRSEPGGAKPRKVSSAPNTAAGNYDLLVANYASREEAASAQGFLRSASCPAFTAVPSVEVEGNRHVTRIVRQ